MQPVAINGNQRKRRALLAIAVDRTCPLCGVRMWSPAWDQHGDEQDKATVDHIQPKSKGGANRRHNLWLVCSRCNTRKADTFDPPALALAALVHIGRIPPVLAAIISRS